MVKCIVIVKTKSHLNFYNIFKNVVARVGVAHSDKEIAQSHELSNRNLN